MRIPCRDKKLKKFVKHRREVCASHSNGDGYPVNTNHHSQMRQIRNMLFENYYGQMQRLGELGSENFHIHEEQHQNDVQRKTIDSLSSAGQRTKDPMKGLNTEANECFSRSLKRWNVEMMLFRKPLPITFWINDTDPLASQIRNYLMSFDSTMLEPITWYPIKNMAWRVLADKEGFRKRPEMQALRHYMIRQIALGTISRQEEVSMIPPFLLDIQPTDICLDLCASPGSKTAQMLVAMGRRKAVPWDFDSAAIFPFDYASQGLIIANELDTKRANMLVHQVKRMQLLLPFALFTNHDARYFPDIILTRTNDYTIKDAATLSPEAVDNLTSILRFDKVLCDVVCSGDGTLRKAPHIFKIWTPREAISLHRIQIRIALRGCHLLKVGGRLVYSTCSLNPIENEAVVAQIIHQTNGSMKLIDARSLLPYLRCAPGLHTWVVTDTSGNVIDLPNESIQNTLFPPKTPGAYSSAAVDAVDLSLCMRFLPSHCNGGGFFIAVLDKVREFRLPTFKSNAEEDAHTLSKKGERSIAFAKPIPIIVPDAGGSMTSDNTVEVQRPFRPEDCNRDVTEKASPSLAAAFLPEKSKSIPPQFLPPPEVIHEALVNFYKINNFPENLLIMRAPHGERKVRPSVSSVCSIVSQTARHVLACKMDSLIVVSAGLRVFSFETLDRGWRIANEAAPLFAKLMSSSPRLLKVPLDFVKTMLLSSGKMKELAFEDVSNLRLRASLEKMPLGTVLLEVDSPASHNGVFFCVALRARTKIQLLVSHEDIPGIELRLGLEPPVESSDSLHG